MSTGAVVALLVGAAVWCAVPSSAGRLARLRSLRPRARGPGAVAGRRNLLRRTAKGLPREPDPALVLDLLAAALSAGAPPDQAIAVVAGAVGGETGQALGRVASRLRLGGSWDAAWATATPGLDHVRRALALAVSTGAPTADLLRGAAEDLRRRRHRRAQAAASRLAVRLVLPLGLCALPTFVAWAVVPVVLSLAGRMLTG